MDKKTILSMIFLISLALATTVNFNLPEKYVVYENGVHIIATIYSTYESTYYLKGIYDDLTTVDIASCHAGSGEIVTCDGIVYSTSKPNHLLNYWVEDSNGVQVSTTQQLYMAPLSSRYFKIPDITTYPFQYVKTIFVNFEYNPSDARNYHDVLIPITINYTSDFRSDFADLRFVFLSSNNEYYELPYDITEKVDLDHISVLVKYPELLLKANNYTATIYVYGKNPSATAPDYTGMVYPYVEDFSLATALDNFEGNCTLSLDSGRLYTKLESGYCESNLRFDKKPFTFMDTNFIVTYSYDFQQEQGEYDNLNLVWKIPISSGTRYFVYDHTKSDTLVGTDYSFDTANYRCAEINDTGYVLRFGFNIYSRTYTGYTNFQLRYPNDTVIFSASYYSIGQSDLPGVFYFAIPPTYVNQTYKVCVQSAKGVYYNTTTGELEWWSVDIYNETTNTNNGFLDNTGIYFLKNEDINATELGLNGEVYSAIAGRDASGNEGMCVVTKYGSLYDLFVQYNNNRFVVKGLTRGTSGAWYDSYGRGYLLGEFGCIVPLYINGNYAGVLSITPDYIKFTTQACDSSYPRSVFQITSSTYVYGGLGIITSNNPNSNNGVRAGEYLGKGTSYWYIAGRNVVCNSYVSDIGNVTIRIGYSGQGKLMQNIRNIYYEIDGLLGYDGTETLAEYYTYPPSFAHTISIENLDDPSEYAVMEDGTKGISLTSSVPDNGQVMTFTFSLSVPQDTGNVSLYIDNVKIMPTKGFKYSSTNETNKTVELYIASPTDYETTPLSTSIDVHIKTDVVGNLTIYLDYSPVFNQTVYAGEYTISHDVTVTEGTHEVYATFTFEDPITITSKKVTFYASSTYQPPTPPVTGGGGGGGAGALVISMDVFPIDDPELIKKYEEEGIEALIEQNAIAFFVAPGKCEKKTLYIRLNTEMILQLDAEITEPLKDYIAIPKGMIMYKGLNEIPITVCLPEGVRKPIEGEIIVKDMRGMEIARRKLIVAPVGYSFRKGLIDWIIEILNMIGELLFGWLV